DYFESILMFRLSSNIKVYLAVGTTDMRKSINGLSVLVSEQMELDVFSGHLFVFCNRKKNIIKVLYWDRNGFCLWQKRLEKDKYPWPDTEEAVKQITYDQLKMLLIGIDFFKAHKQVIYEEMN
ncbi:MAG: IS66 family insertion sequence element accessory protein TnpB, partial [Spirochaetales bacterium]|nr:IS66 family insertion sequence element accessory protein TnpB [Spirochaetales bacterium]